MGKLSTKKINTSDYSKSNQSDVANLARSLNPLMDDLERLFRKGLTVDDNLPFQYVTFSCEVDNTSTLKTAVKLSTSLTTTIKGCLVVNAVSTSADPIAALGGIFTLSNNTIDVKKIFGIPANTKFDITLLVVS